jgi:hypothetical protein
MSLILVWAARAITIALAVFAIVLARGRYWRRPADNPIPLLWLIHWSALLAQTVLLFLWDIAGLHTMPFVIRLIAVQAGWILSFLRSCTLVMVAESLPVAGRAPSTKRFRAVIWLVSVSLILVPVTQLAGLPHAGELIDSYVGFFATLWFAARWVAMMAPRRGMYAAFLLFLYASLQVVYIGRTMTLDVFALNYTCAVLLYGALVYAGYYSLALDPNQEDTVHAAASAAVVLQSEPHSAPVLLPPTPTVEIKLDNFFGFLYLLWTHPSGRGAVITLAALAVTFVLAIVSIVVKQ